MSRRTLRRTTALAVTAVLSFSLTACSGDDTEPTASEQSPSESSSPTDEATPSESPSESPTGEETQSAGEDVDAFLDRLKAGFGDKGSVHVSLKLTGPQKIQGEGDTVYGPDGSDLRMTMLMDDMGEQEITMILSDKRVFVSMPGLTPAGKFFEVAEDDPLYSQLGSTGMSPADSFAGFEAGLEKVEPVGPEKIGGQQTEHVKLHVDAARAMEAMEMGAVPGLPDTLVYDVWLDPQDRMRRITYALAGTKVVMEMTQWGSDVRIDVPPKKDIVEAPQMQG
jgi:hypothetical protein